jgi:transcription antitermination factor NusG
MNAETVQQFGMMRYLFSHGPRYVLTAELRMVDGPRLEYWYALRVKNRFESSVSTHLRSLGVEEFLPTYEISRVRRGKRISEQLPLFPGYLFIHMEWRGGPRLYRVPGVLEVVGSGGTPLPVADEEMDVIRRVTNPKLEVSPWPDCKTGDLISLIDGPLRGLQGNYVRQDGHNRIVVSVPMLQRSVAVVMEKGWAAPMMNCA